MGLQPVTGVASGAVGSDTGTYGGGKLGGFVISETAAATASVNVRDGTVTGTILFRINLAANGTVVVMPMDYINFPAGDVYFEVVSGTVRWTALKA